ncbi:MAG: hypothetical protein M3252_06855 [Actinomycetota bacterium]|nr:hypothetical protein [Actinomycetota bacterium]
MKRKHPRLVAAFGLATIGLALGAPGTATAHGQPHAVPIKQATFHGHATGTYLHAHLLQSATARLVNANVAGSAAAVDYPKGLAQIADEVGRIVVPTQAAGKNSWGRGVALEAGLLEEYPSEEASLLSLAGVATQAAPPTVGTPDVQDINLDLDPLLYLSLLRGEASANWDSNNPCVYKAPGGPRNPLGPPPQDYTADFGFGHASVANVELLDLDSGDDAEPGLEGPLLATNVTTGQGIKERPVGWTASQSFLAGQYSEPGAIEGKPLAPDYGLVSETRATLLPITLFTGGSEITIEVLGPWRLVGAAGGVPGSAWVHFGPEAKEPNQPVLRISTRSIDPQTGVFTENNTDVITVEQLVGNEGLRLDLSPLLVLSLGEGPRAIGNEDEGSAPTEAADGTRVSAAADILRLEVLEAAEQPGTEVAEIRLGHMEVEAEVPRGGLSCEPPRPPVVFPPTGDDEVSDSEREVTDLLPAIDQPAGQEAGQVTGRQETGQESLKAESVRRQLPPSLRAFGLFSAVVAILVSSGAFLFRRWSRS